MWAQEKSLRGAGGKVTIDNSVGLTASILSAELHLGNVFSSYDHLCHCRILAVCAVLLYLHLLHQMSFFYGKQLLKEGGHETCKNGGCAQHSHTQLYHKEERSRQNAERHCIEKALQKAHKNIVLPLVFIMMLMQYSIPLNLIGCNSYSIYNSPKANGVVPN